MNLESLFIAGLSSGLTALFIGVREAFRSQTTTRQEIETPYRTPAVVTPREHLPKKLGNGTVITSCDTPGWWASCKVDLETKWTCDVCGKQWILIRGPTGAFEWAKT